MTITRETKRRVMLATAAVAFVVLLTAALMPTTPAAATTPQQALAAALAGQYSCTMTDQANGFTLTCVTPTSPSPTPSASSSPSPTPSASSSPSPSPTVTGGNNCQANPGACGFPDALSTGPTTPLTPSTRTFYGTAGEKISGVSITGCVDVRAPNVTFQNVQFNAGGCFWGVRNFSVTNGVVTNYPGLQVIDSAITCAGTNGTAFGSYGISLQRVEISRCENGLNVAGSVSVSDSWVHDMNGSNGGAHTDGAQFNQGASDIVFSHNTINVGPQNGATSAIIMWDEGGAQNARVTIDRNLLAGGTYTLYCGREGAVDNVRITNNRFGTFEYGYANDCNNGETWFGNADDSTGAQLSPQ